MIRHGSPGAELGRRGRRRGAAARPTAPTASGRSSPPASSTSRLRSSATTSAGSRHARAAAAGPSGAAARCTAARRSPARKQATIASTHSGRLPSSVSTTSPRRDAARVRAARASRARLLGDLAEASTRGGRRRAPARRCASGPGGAASTTSRAKFTPSTSHRPHSPGHAAQLARGRGPRSAGPSRRRGRGRCSRRAPRPGARLAHHPRGDVDREPADVVADDLAPRRCAGRRGPRARAPSTSATIDARGADRARRAVEQRPGSRRRPT